MHGPPQLTFFLNFCFWDMFSLCVPVCAWDLCPSASAFYILRKNPHHPSALYFLMAFGAFFQALRLRIFVLYYGFALGCVKGIILKYRVEGKDYLEPGIQPWSTMTPLTQLKKTDGTSAFVQDIEYNII